MLKFNECCTFFPTFGNVIFHLCGARLIGCRQNFASRCNGDSIARHGIAPVCGGSTCVLVRLG